MAAADRLTGWFTRLVFSATTMSILASLSSLLSPTPAQAQAPASNAAAISGQVSTSTGQPAVSAQVRVCPITAQGAPCVPLATLFTNSALTVQTQNPLSTDQFGNYKAFVAAGLYLVQVYISSQGPVYTYYVSAGTANNGSASSPPPYTIQFASPTTGQFASDPTIFINPSQHILETPELFVPGSGTGVIGLTGATSAGTFSQTVSNTTSTWDMVWPSAAPAGAGTFCLTAPAGAGTPSTTIASWQACILSGSFLPLSGGTLTGALVGQAATFSAVNGVVNAASCGGTDAPGWCAGTDLGGWINAAIASCTSQCTIYVPAGSYNFSTTILAPLNTVNTYELKFDPGAVMNYTGSADILDGYVNTSSPTTSNLKITGGTFTGGSATAGIHVQPTNTVHISDMSILSIAGPAIWLEGVNAAWIENNYLDNDLIGMEFTPTYCSGATCGLGVTGGQAYSVNAVHILNNTVVFSGQWGIYFFDAASAALTPPLGDEIAGNDLEHNGTTGSSFGAVYIGRSQGMVIRDNYFESSPRQLTLGLNIGTFFASVGPVVRDNYFTTLNSTPYEIELQNTVNALVEGNSSLDVTQNSGNCFLNGTTESATVIGQNYYVLSGGGSYLCEGGAGVVSLTGTGSYTQLNANLIAYIANGNYLTLSAGTSETVALAGNVTTSSACYVTPFNATAGALAANVYLVVTGPNTATFYHPSSVNGSRWNFWCTAL